MNTTISIRDMMPPRSGADSTSDKKKDDHDPARFFQSDARRDRYCGNPDSTARAEVYSIVGTKAKSVPNPKIPWQAAAMRARRRRNLAILDMTLDSTSLVSMLL